MNQVFCIQLKVGAIYDAVNVEIGFQKGRKKGKAYPQLTVAIYWKIVTGLADPLLISSFVISK